MHFCLVLLVALASADDCPIAGECPNGRCCTDSACETKTDVNGGKVECCDTSDPSVMQRIYSGTVVCSVCDKYGCSKYLVLLV